MLVVLQTFFLCSCSWIIANPSCVIRMTWASKKVLIQKGFSWANMMGKTALKLLSLTDSGNVFIYLCISFAFFGCLACHVWIAAIGNVTACLLIDVICLCFFFFFWWTLIDVQSTHHNVSSNTERSLLLLRTMWFLFIIRAIHYASQLLASALSAFIWIQYRRRLTTGRGILIQEKIDRVIK